MKTFLILILAFGSIGLVVQEKTQPKEVVLGKDSQSDKYGEVAFKQKPVSTSGNDREHEPQQAKPEHSCRNHKQLERKRRRQHRRDQHRGHVVTFDQLLHTLLFRFREAPQRAN